MWDLRHPGHSLFAAQIMLRKDNQRYMRSQKNRIPRIVYRADGGYPIGMGHIQRALRLSKALADILPFEMILASREDKAVRQVVQEADLDFLRLEILPSGPRSVFPKLDMIGFRDLLENMRPDLTIIDMLDTPAAEMAAVAASTNKLASLDDRGPGRKYCDLLVNVLVRDPDPRELKDGAELLEGPSYVTLSKEFSDVAGLRRTDEPEVARSMLVTVGGADAAGLALKAAKALLAVEEIREVAFVVGPAFAGGQELKRLTQSAPWRIRIEVNAPTLLPLFLQADMAIVAGGFTMHEAACCGVPAIAIAQPIDHQLLVAGWLEAAGTLISLGYAEEKSENELALAVSRLALDRKRRQEMSISGPRTVDGRGTARTAAALARLI